MAHRHYFINGYCECGEEKNSPDQLHEQEVSALKNQLQIERERREELIKENTRLREALTQVTKSFFHHGVEIARKALEE